MTKKKLLVRNKSHQPRPLENNLKFSAEDKFIVWTFRNIDRDGKFAFDVNREDFNVKEFLQKMLEYSNLKWSELRQHTHDKNKSKHHFLSMDSLSKEALERIKRKGFESEVESLFSFALNNTTRIIGFRDHAEFQVVWYDANHEFASSTLSHT